MKIELLADDRIRLEGTAGPLTIEAESPETSYSPFHMVASGLATCVFSVLASWGEHAEIGVADLSIEVGWHFADQPKRVGGYDLSIRWPSLPEERRAAAVRAAGLCPVHQTLENPTHVEMEVAA